MSYCHMIANNDDITIRLGYLYDLITLLDWGIVMIDGIIKYDSSDPNTPKPTDFELGIISPNENRL